MVIRFPSIIPSYSQECKHVGKMFYLSLFGNAPTLVQTPFVRTDSSCSQDREFSTLVILGIISLLLTAGTFSGNLSVLRFSVVDNLDCSPRRLTVHIDSPYPSLL